MTADIRTDNAAVPGNPLSLTRRAIPWILVATLGAVAFYWDGLISLGAAWARPEYSYGPLVPLITIYMTLLEIHRHPVKPDHGSRAVGMVVFALALLVGLVGNLVDIPDIITYGFILYVGAFLLLLAGPAGGIRFWPGWLHLIFMLPLPQFIYLKISTQLQSLSAEIGVSVIQFMVTVLLFPAYNIISRLADRKSVV